MSHHHGGHRSRKHPKDDYQRHDYFETPDQKLRKSIVSFGEVDPLQELPRLVKQIVEHEPANVPIVAEGLRIGVTEQPFKIPYYAALLRLLFDQPAVESSATSFGKQVFEDFWKGFQTFLDKQAWRETRLCVQFFAHLTIARVISVPTLYSLLKSFADVHLEINTSQGRATKALLCAAEGLVIAGAVIKQESSSPEEASSKVAQIIDALKSHIDATQDSKFLVQPLVQLHSTNFVLENADEWLDCALAALQTLDGQDFAQTAECVPQPYMESPPFADTPYDLPLVLVPPEVEEETLTTDTGEDAIVKKEEWPRCYVRLFDDDITPDPTSPAGFILRSNILDIVDIFEVNRKECARLLLEYPKWTVPGTFVARSGAPPQPTVEGRNWLLDNTLIETILGSNFVLPESNHKSVYYIALITELCKTSPQTVGPAVGKSVRRLFSLLADGLDVEVAHRYAEWFSVHLSNFGFSWPWKEWEPDLSLVPQHPKRTFMRKVVELEIRLSYHDRVSRGLPESMVAADAQVISVEAPGPEFEFEDAEHPDYEAAQSVLNLLRGRAKPDDVMAHLETLRNGLTETVEPDVNVDSLLRSIAVQSLLSIGSRSFSHFLNAIERYLPLLRNLAVGAISTAPANPTTDAVVEARTDIMSAVATVWRRSRHQVLIVFDKLMQYQIVEPSNVVVWSFAHCTAATDGVRKQTFNAFQWNVLRSALDKANGRVMVQRRKIAALRREADDKAARAIAGENAAMEVDTEPQPVAAAPAGESPQLTTAVNAFKVLSTEQKMALSKAFEGFIGCLAVDDISPAVGEVITEHSWHNRANWENDAWETWETWGWYRHWSRTFSPYLRNYVETFESLAMTKITASGPVADMFRQTWSIASGQMA
ncbi:cap binding protein 80-PB [Epithele typhae]|uniref:cap binding protein 80-PB n=1 Tax=Epithele typhae TaxID=378194 RepID=UPI002007246B|nr:cap binding protein 80-PB [Epithele typhae]KAH9921501.1 cap binding protein 80-PB [Epithele typhae]